MPGTPGTPCGEGLDTCMKTSIKYPGGAIITKTCSSVAGKYYFLSNFSLLNVFISNY